MADFEKLKTELANLEKVGMEMTATLFASTQKNSAHKSRKAKKLAALSTHYQKWYSESIELIKRVLPERADEFRQLYFGDAKRKDINLTTYAIRDWMLGLRAGDKFDGTKSFSDQEVVLGRLHLQTAILESVSRKFESALMDIKHLVQADLFDDELAVAGDLLKHQYIRPAGVIAGVVLEKHLAGVLQNHNIKIAKSEPGISDLNNELKAAELVEIPTWRFIQHLADLRNLCGHNKGREPLFEEISELIVGVRKISKTIF